MAQLVARHEIARPLDEQPQDLKRLIREADSGALLSELAGLQIELEDAKAQNLSRPHGRRV